MVGAHNSMTCQIKGKIMLYSNTIIQIISYFYHYAEKFNEIAVLQKSICIINLNKEM